MVHNISEIVEGHATAQTQGAATFLVNIRGVGAAAPGAHPNDVNAWPANTATAPGTIQEALNQCLFGRFGGVDIQVLAITHFGAPSQCTQ